MSRRNLFPVATVPSIPAADINAAAAGGVRAVGTSAAGTNVAGGRITTPETFSFLTTGGALQANPVLQSIFGAQNRQLVTSAKKASGSLVATQNKIASAEKRLANAKTPAQRARVEKNLTNLRTREGKLQTQLTDLVSRSSTLAQTVTQDAPSMADAIQEAMAPTYDYLGKVEERLNQMGEIGAAGQEAIRQMAEGYKPQAINFSPGAYATAQRTTIGQPAPTIYAEGIAPGILGSVLMNRAVNMSLSDGSLSPEAARDATQAARAAFASRGLTTGNAAVGAELLNRDRMRRGRMFEDLGFATGVQQQDLARQQQNQEAALRAAMANQSMISQYGLAQADLDQRLQLFNADQIQRMNQFNASGGLQASGATAESMRLGTQLGASLLGQATGLEQLYQDRAIGGLSQNLGLQTQYNPTMMALNMDPFGGRNVGTASIPAGASLGSTWGQLQQGTNEFNALGQNWASGLRWSQNNMPSMQSGMGSAVGSLGGMALGAGVGALLAAPTGGMSITTGAMLGAGLGGGAGAGIGGLMFR